jgi:segregation and condensation protein B
VSSAAQDKGTRPTLRLTAAEHGLENGAEGNNEIRNALECLLLARGGPLRIAEIRKVLDVGEAEIRATLAALQVEYVGRGLQIQEIAGGFQLCTRPEYSEYVQRLLRLREMEPLTRATLEVLAIVAYRQPVTRPEVDAIRGVQSVHHLIRLLERRLICPVGRRSGPGRPILYGTTEGFLRHFGLKDLGALPPMDGHDSLIPPPAP